MGDPNSDGGRWGTRYQRAARRRHPAFVAVSQERASIPISASPAPATPTQSPIRTLGRFGPRFWARGPRATRQHPSCISVQHPRARAISRPIPGSCTKVQHEAANLSFADPALVHAELQQGGSAAPRRLRGAPVEQYPHLRPFLRARGKRLAVDGETWLNPSVTFLGFRVSGNPTSSLWQTHLVWAADW
jgi:hypothetical protein